MKSLYAVINVFTTLILALCISLSTAVAPTADPFVPPEGSPLAKEQIGEKHIADMEAAAQDNAARNTSITALNSQNEKTGHTMGTYDIGAEDFTVDQQRIETEILNLHREVTADIEKIKQDTKKLDSETPEQWVTRMTHKFNVFPHTGTRIIFSDSNPCDDDKLKRSGCVTQNLDLFGHPSGTNIKLYLDPSAVGNIYVLFHEIGHTKGILDECTADQYSRSITGLPGGFYC